MKLGLFILGLSLTQNVLATGHAQLSCKGAGHTQFGIGTQKSERIGNLVHNYSAAQVACPLSISEFLKNTVKMRCYGSWLYDRNNEGTSYESLAWIEITRSGSQITAVTQTNRVYGQRIKNMNCSLTTTERQ